MNPSSFKLARASSILDPWAARLRLEGSYYDGALGKEVAYRASHAPRGLASSSLAGVLSGLLGVGGGVIQVPAMNLVMGLPLKTSTATSNRRKQRRGLPRAFSGP